MDEKSSYKELLYAICGAGKSVVSEDTDTVVAFFALSADPVSDPGTPLASVLEKIQSSMHID